MLRKPGKEHIPRRSPPDLPPSTDNFDLVGADELNSGQQWDQSLFRNIELSKHSLPALTARNSVLDHVTLAGCEILSAHLRDVRLVKCDLSNAVLRRFEATRVEFIDCRLTGIRAIECRWRDVLVDNSDMRYSQFSNSRLLDCEIRKSNLAESDLRSADLEGTIFADATLNQADLTGANLRGVDLRSSEIDGITLHPDDIRGAIVSPAQALELSRLLGIIIK